MEVRPVNNPYFPCLTGPLGEKRQFSRDALVKRIKNIILSELTHDLNSDYRNTIFLAGTGRSGTTWISKVINHRNEYRYMFEPFHPYKVNICNHFRYRQYLRPENKEPRYLRTAEKILSGQINNYWIDSHNNKLFAKKRLIKDIRANLMLKWIHVNFPDMPIILLLRHPCAVANSKLKLNWNTHLEEFLAQDELIEDHLAPFKKEIEKARDDFEKHVFLWCIENYLPIKQFSVGKIHLAFYENYCADPREEIRRLFLFLNKNIDESVFAKLCIPSELTRKDSAIITGDSLIDGWRKYITNEQIRRTIDILNIFGLDKIYSEESIPNIERAYKILEGAA